MLNCSRRLLGGGDKSSFAAKRRVLHPIYQNPAAPASIIRKAYTTNAMKESRKIEFGGSAVESMQRLEGERSRKEIAKGGDKEFDAFVAFLRGAEADQMISAKRFEEVYDALSEKDETFIWLCMTSMAILNPGDVRSRLIYRHLEALAQAVAAGEMSQRTAFRFYESAVRSPAFRELSKRQLERGNSTRLAGLVAAADIMKKEGISRRPMSSYFELFQRISERSEALAPWGFPPLFQFENQIQLEPRLRFFRRPLPEDAKTAKGTAPAIGSKRIFALPPNWRFMRRYAGPWWSQHTGVIPD